MNNNLIFLNFAISAFAYYLLSELIKALITDAPAQKVFLMVLLIICIIFALFGYLLFHI